MSAVAKAANLPRLAKKITAEHEAAEQCAREAIGHARAAGILLIEAKEAVGHGNFGNWLEAHFDFSDSTAQSYMLVARRWPELEAKTQHAGNLSIRGALRLLSAPTDKQPDKPAKPEPPKLDDSERYAGILVGTDWFRPTDRSGWLEEFGAVDMRKLAAPEAIVVVRTSGSKEATRRADVLLGRWQFEPIDWAIVVTGSDASEELVVGYTGNVDVREWLPHPPEDRSSVVLVKRPASGLESLVRSWLTPFAESVGCGLAHVAGADHHTGYINFDTRGQLLAA